MQRRRGTHPVAFAAPAALVRSAVAHSVCNAPRRRVRLLSPHGVSRAHACAKEADNHTGGVPCDVSVVLLAGGRGTRMGSETPKQLLDLAGASVLERSLRAFQGLPEVREVVVILAEELRSGPAGRACAAAGAIFAEPGADRAGSVLSGARACVPGGLICVHDAARPLVRPARVQAVIQDARKSGAAALAVPCKATVKRSVDGHFVEKTLDRELLWEMQTPQVVRADVLCRGLEEAFEAGAVVTDDVSVVERLGMPVKLTLGDYDNVKITTPDDLLFAEAVLRDQRDQGGASN